MANLISHDELLRLLHYDAQTGQFTRLAKIGKSHFEVGSIAGTVSKHHGYRFISLCNLMYRAHRLAIFYMTGKWPSSEIDHINGIRSDNRFCNLREVSHVHNQHNIAARKQNRSGLLGVSTQSDDRRLKYGARISVAGKRIYLGSFTTPEEAHMAFIAYKKEMKLPTHRSTRTNDSAQLPADALPKDAGD